MLDPILLGAGKKLFPDDGVSRAWQLTDSVTTSTGALLLTYAQALG